MFCIGYTDAYVTLYRKLLIPAVAVPVLTVASDGTNTGLLPDFSVGNEKQPAISIACSRLFL